MSLTDPQIAHVKRQLDQHDRDTADREIVLGTEDEQALTLRISRGVFGSDIMSSGIYTARYLAQNSELYRGKTCLDMGCGPGTQGIVMAEHGALKVTLADVSPRAVKDATENTRSRALDNTEVIESDLFDNLPNQTWDFVVFNHPFFPESPENFEGLRDVMLGRSMLAPPELLERFLHEIPARLPEDGKLLMPYFQFAGPENNPEAKYKQFGLELIAKEDFESDQGLQLGEFSICLLGKGR